MLKVVIDTNVFISGLVKSPSCRKIIKALEKWEFMLVISPDIPIVSPTKFLRLLNKSKSR